MKHHLDNKALWNTVFRLFSLRISVFGRMFQEKYQNARPKDITDNTILLVMHIPS